MQRHRNLYEDNGPIVHPQAAATSSAKQTGIPVTYSLALASPWIWEGVLNDASSVSSLESDPSDGGSWCWWRGVLATIQELLSFTNGPLPFVNFVLFLNGQPFRSFFRISEQPTQADHELPLRLSKILRAISNEVQLKIGGAKHIISRSACTWLSTTVNTFTCFCLA